MLEYIKIGSIVKAQGIKGEVKIYPSTDKVERFFDIDEVYIGKNDNSLKTIGIESVRIYKGFPLIKFKSVKDRNQAEELRNYNLYVDRDNTVKLTDGQYLVCDLINIDVYENDKKIGVLDDVIKTGANDVYVIKENDGNKLLIPAIKQCVKNIDIKDKRMDITVMKGLRDD